MLSVGSAFSSSALLYERARAFPSAADSGLPKVRSCTPCLGEASEKPAVRVNGGHSFTAKLHGRNEVGTRLGYMQAVLFRPSE